MVEEEDPSDSEDMLEALQTRHTQRLEEYQPVNDSPKVVVEVSSKPKELSPRGSGGEDASTGRQSRSQSQGSSTLNMSIKERLRNRAKAGGDKSLQPRKLRGLRERTLPTRFEESANIGPVTEELDPILQKSIATTKHWKKLKSKRDRDAGIISEEDAFQFFVGSIDNTEEDVKAAEISPVSDATVDLNVIEESPFFPERVKPEYISQKDRLLFEEKNYFYPSSIPALPEVKIQGGMPVRNLEDEGFYVGRAPQVGLANLSRMENRIIAAEETSKGWFGADGHLKRLADPLKERAVHHMFTDDLLIDPLLQLDWGKAELASLDTRYIDEHGNQHYQLDVDISMIRFLHQQLFSKEHYMEYKLIELYEHYILREKNGLLEHLKNRIHALYTELQHIKQIKDPQGEEEAEDARSERANRLRDIHLQIRELRVNCQNEEIQGRALLMNILHTWKSLKKLREGQGYVNTATTLKVRKELTNRVSDEAEINEELEQQVESERFLFQENYYNELKIYEEKLLKWKKYQRQMRKQQQKEAAGEHFEQEEITDVPKPEPPNSFDDKQVQIDIREWMMKFKRKPGHPNLFVDLQNGAVITPTEKCPRGEQLRRAEMKNSKYMVKVVFNDMEVARTAVRGLSNDFVVQFGEILNIRILQWPESIKFQIYDASTMKMLAELYGPIPELTVLSSHDIPLTELEFSSDHIVQYNRHDAIGCGVPVQLNLKLDEEQSPVIPLTSGILSAAVSWGVGEDGASLGPPASAHSTVNASKHFDAVGSIGAEGMVDLQKLLSWISQAKLDPNDPVNADIITLARMAQLSHYNNAGGPEFFRLNHLDSDMEFITKEEMEANKRFKLIRLRTSGVFEFKHYHNIPVDEKFISDDLFDEYERKQSIAMPDAGKLQHKEAVAVFLEKVRQKVHSRYEMAKRRVDLEDIVIEEAIPDLGSLGIRIAQIMEPRRPLRPMRKERKKIGGQGLASVKEVNILVNIIRAFNLLLREFKSLPRPIDQSLAASLSTNIHVNPERTVNVQSLYPFIEVVFQGNSLTTSVAEGSFPNWNEDLILPFKAPNNDYTSEALQLIKDNIFISLFDEVLVDALQDERLRETTIHRRIERRYLGRIEIPFSTVYFNSKVEGYIPLKTPEVLLGYQPSNDKLSGINMVKEVPLVQLFVTIDPQLQPAPPMPEIFESNEDDMLVKKSQQWLSELRAKFPNRIYKLMVTDLDGKKVFVTRYIHPQKPPDELLVHTDVPDMQKMRLLSRFVYLIPYISDSVQFPDLCDIWTTSEQFLRMLAGDEEEHAVLLCNYFLWLGKKAYVVLGYGIPEGSSAYVLTEEGVSFRLWNPSTGESYEVENTHCPLRSIGCVIAPDNVYGNVQRDDHPSKISFRFSFAKSWKPFFTRSYPNPGLASVQEDSLPCMKIDTQHAINVQDELERVIRDKLMEWRPTSITKFNRGCNQAFKTLLENIESKIVLSEISATEHRRYLDQFASSHHLTGYTIQMPYTNHKSVIDSVFCTGIHNIEDPSVEFAIAVHVHPYPNSVEAVWVYIGSLVRKGK